MPEPFRHAIGNPFPVSMESEKMRQRQSRVKNTLRNRSKRKRFRAIHAAYIAEQTRADQLREQVRQSWDRACRYDGINPDSSCVVFSVGNPHKLACDSARAALVEELAKS